MISETRFAKSYNSLWRSIAPTMELFVRKCNLRLYERNWPELVSVSEPGGRAHVNRTAFELFCRAYEHAHDPALAFEFMHDPANIAAAELAVSGVEIMINPEKSEVFELARRMWLHFYRSPGPLTLNPVFPGCGIINTCAGDVIRQPSHIVEFKDGDRAFRSYEFRQLSIYAALSLNGTDRMPTSLEVLNSRRGISVSVNIDQFADEVAGQSGVEYLREIIRVISDVGQSL